jgi:tetratricopeptide (TPR) repeat protein
MALGNPVPSDYPALFRNYLKRATRSALQPPTPRDTFPQTGGYERTSQLIHTLTYALQSPDMWEEAKALLFSLSDTLERTARHADLISLLEAGIEQSKTIGDYATYALLQLKLSPFIISQGDSDRAYQILTEAQTYFETQALPLHQGQVLNELARWAIERGNYSEAALYLDRALERIPADMVNELAITQRLRGSLAATRQEWQNAYVAYSNSLQLWKLGGNPRFIGFGYINLGSALRGLGNYEEATIAIKEGIQRFEAAEDLVNRALAQNNLGNLYLNSNRYQEAIEQYHAAEMVFRQLNRITELARLYNNWGMAYAGLEWWNQAITTYQQSIGYWKTLQNPPQLANVLDNLGLAYFGAGQYKASADVFRQGLAELEQGEESNDPILHAGLLQHLAKAEAALTPPRQA